MTLRSKLLLAQLPLAIALLSIGAFSRATVHTLSLRARDVLKDNHLSVLAAQHMRDAAGDLDRLTLLHATGPATGAPSAGAGSDGQAAGGVAARFERELIFQEHNITEPGEAEMTARLRERWNSFHRRTDEILTSPPGVPDPWSRYVRDVVPARAALDRSTDEIADVNQDAMVRKSERSGREAQERSSMVLATTLLACLLGIVASTVLTSRIVRPLSVLTLAVRRLGQGDLGARAKIEGSDEIAQLATEFNTMARHLSEYRQSSLGELLQAQRASQATIDSLPDPVIVLDGGGGVINVNEAAEKLLHVEVGDPDSALRDAVPAVREIVGATRAHVQGGKGAFVPRGLEDAAAVVTSDGTRFYLARANPVLDEDGAVSGLTILLQDVSRLRHFDELKNDLVATVAHEFRTPLTSLRMAIHLLAEEVVGPILPKQADLLYAAREDCERLQGIVDDLLDLSRIQAGRIELHVRPCVPAVLLDAALEPHRILAREKGITVEATASTDQLALVDPDRLQLVLTNLITNALRHTPPGGRVALTARSESGKIRFEITDTGSGIAPEFLTRIFERFYRIPGAPSGGAGLGLYIAKEIVDAHGGAIGVESHAGTGSKFWFTVPAEG